MTPAAQKMLSVILALMVGSSAHADDTHATDAQTRFKKGVLLAEQNKPDEAITVFTRLTEDYKDLPEPYNNLAVLYAAQGQYDKARVVLEKALRTNPSYHTAYENLGDIYGKLASQAYDKALALGTPTTAPAKSNLTLLRTLAPAAKVAAASVTLPMPAKPAPAPLTAALVAPPAAAPAPQKVVASAPVAPAAPQAPQKVAVVAAAAAPASQKVVATAPVVAAPAAPQKVAAAAPVVATASVSPVAQKAAVVAPAVAPPPPKAAAAPVVVTPAASPAPQKVAVAPALVAKPAPAKPDTSERDAVMAQVHGWAKAWAAQNVDAYLGFYSQQFEPPKGLTRKAWADERRARIEGKGRIRVEVASPEVSINGNNAKVTFRQTYESDRLTARSRKTLLLVKHGGKWQIKQEASN